MKIRSTFAVLALCGSLCAQTLNPAGHFINTGNEELTYKVVQTPQGDAVEIDSFTLLGSTAFKTAQGYLTLSGNYENAPSTLRIFSAEGKEVFSKSFAQTINFALSASRNFCVFHDMQKIWVIDIAANTSVSLEGSNVFAVDDAGKAAYYNEKTGSVTYDASSIAISEAVYRVIFFNGQPLFITKTAVLRIKDNTLVPVFTAAEGRVFDVAVISGKFCVSVKKEKPGEFVFNAFSSSDLVTFTAGEEVHYPLASSTSKKKEKEKRISPNEQLLANETILDPIDYYNDTVYQPIGNSYNEMQEYTPGSMYPHPGVDLLGTYLQNTYSVKKGYVKAILTTSGQYHWRIAISNNNTAAYSQGYLYAHMQQNTIPYVVGDSVNPGDVVGQLVNFPVTGFVHCHFARIGCTGTTWSGNWRTYDNPLSYMTNFFDTIPPTFEITLGSDPFAFRDVNGNYLAFDSLYGTVDVISKVYDRINATWRCDVNSLRYSVSPLSQPTTMLLDSLAFDYHYHNDFYYTGPTYLTMLKTIYSRDASCFSTADYGIRDFYHIVTNSDGNDTITGNDSLQVFNTLSLPDGSYIFRVIATDPSGNTSRDSMIIEIKNLSSGVNSVYPDQQVSIYPNPFSEESTLLVNRDLNNATLSLYDPLGREVKRTENISGSSIKLQRGNLAPGMYFIKLNQEGKTFFTGKIIVAD